MEAGKAQNDAGDAEHDNRAAVEIELHDLCFHSAEQLPTDHQPKKKRDHEEQQFFGSEAVRDCAHGPILRAGSVRYG